MKRQYHFPAQEMFERETDTPELTINSDDDEVEWAVEDARPEFYLAWYEYIDEFYS